jgi:hypothetical protein
MKPLAPVMKAGKFLRTISTGAGPIDQGSFSHKKSQKTNSE